MSILHAPTAAEISPGLLSWLKSFRQRLAQAFVATAPDRKVAKAIRELSRLADHELDDIGLCRSDLTPEGLAAAGSRRSLRQAVIDAEIARRTWTPAVQRNTLQD